VPLTLKFFTVVLFFSQTVYDHSPIVAGHEYVGEVVELGPGAKEKYDLKVGDKAIAEVILPCGECYFCKHGRYNLCNAAWFLWGLMDQAVGQNI